MGQVCQNLPGISCRSSGKPLTIDSAGIGIDKYCPDCCEWLPLTTDYWYWIRRKKPRRPCEVTGEWSQRCKVCHAIHMKKVRAARKSSQ